MSSVVTGSSNRHSSRPGICVEGEIEFFTIGAKQYRTECAPGAEPSGAGDHHGMHAFFEFPVLHGAGAIEHVYEPNRGKSALDRYDIEDLVLQLRKRDFPVRVPVQCAYLVRVVREHGKFRARQTPDVGRSDSAGNRRRLFAFRPVSRVECAKHAAVPDVIEYLQQNILFCRIVEQAVAGRPARAVGAQRRSRRAGPACAAERNRAHPGLSET